MRRILRLMLLSAGGYRREYLRCLQSSAAASIAQAAAYATLIPLLYELTQPTVDAGAAWRWFGVFVACYLVETAFRLYELRFQYTQWANVLADVRLRLGEKLRTIPQRDLEQRAAGDLTTVVGGNTANATMGASTIGLLFAQLIAVPIVLGVIILVVDWRLGLVLALAVPFAVFFVRRIQQASGSGFRRVDAADARAANRIVEYVQGLPVLKASGQAGARSRRLTDALAAQGETLTGTQKRMVWPGLLASSIVQLALVAMAAAGSALVLDVRLSAPLLLAIMAGAVRFAEPLATASSMTAVFELTDAALERVGEVLEAPALPVGDPGARIERFDLSLEDVTFGYGAEPVLRGVSFTAAERSLTALVGPSGSGKTTIAKLLTRYADPAQGTVRIGGRDLRVLDPAEIYRHISVVFQDVYLFDDTIRSNIAMAKPDATDEEIEAAARAANVHTFVSRLPRGYDTRVGEIGGSLSGGERQRISIARAILKNAPIVLLDEPTAALDTESETAVQAAVDALVADRTVLVIAHRLSTVVAADQILVLEDGRITERGTHGDLIEAGGRYTAMWAAQTRARGWRVRSSSTP
ncbi:ABC transporter permease [Acrocarpospora pleiomorpha]|uniref:ABC transporter permease n=1 Tax=Acrocarpospora pleiomorpha TaxID=90975 RepID=A0A5M3XBS8_9ACTN|nr:ABC transporter ATP-binding protein [Acrocarpospora pleiomorpha]GES18096.1 ABC transporter permease [Acrocarpospora pleiomorpha]